MRGLFTSKTLTIPSGQAVSGIARRPQMLRIQRGRVWITVEGISHDYFLHAGDTFTAVPGRLTVIEADQEASVDLSLPNTGHVLQGIGKLIAALAQRLSHGNVIQTTPKRPGACDAC